MNNSKISIRKQLLFCMIAIGITISSCTSTRVIGSVNMISHRNIDSKADYVLLQAYAGGTEKEIKESRALTIEDAIDNTVKSVPGGEFLKNAKIYVVMRGKHAYYACIGDVWGISGVTETYKGMKPGDKVTWKNPKLVRSSTDPKYFTGVIVSIKLSDHKAVVKKDKTDTTAAEDVEVDLDELSKVE